MSKRMFQRASTFAQNAGINLTLTHDHGRHDKDKDGLDDQGIDKRYVCDAAVVVVVAIAFRLPFFSVCGQAVQGFSSSSVDMLLFFVVGGQEV